MTTATTDTPTVTTTDPTSTTAVHASAATDATGSDAATGSQVGGTPVEEFVHVDLRGVLIGANVRADTRQYLKEFRRSIKERGVLEAITVYRDEEGR